MMDLGSIGSSSACSSGSFHRPSDSFQRFSSAGGGVAGFGGEGAGAESAGSMSSGLVCPPGDVEVPTESSIFGDLDDTSGLSIMPMTDIFPPIMSTGRRCKRAKANSSQRSFLI